MDQAEWLAKAVGQKGLHWVHYPLLVISPVIFRAAESQSVGHLWSKESQSCFQTAVDIVPVVKGLLQYEEIPMK